MINRRYTKGIPILSKLAYETVQGWTSGRSLSYPYKTPLIVPRCLSNRPIETQQLFFLFSFFQVQTIIPGAVPAKGQIVSTVLLYLVVTNNCTRS